MILVWAILFLILAITLAAFAFGGIAVAVSFFTKLLFFVAFICFLISLILIVVEKMRRKEKNL